MANLFFVHTPVQMVIAQQLIHQEKLVHNIRLFGIIDNNTHFKTIYDLLIIDNLWEDSIYYEHLPACVDLSLRKPIKCFYNIFHNIHRIDAIIRKYNITNIYLGDIDNIGYQFLMFYYKNKVKVNIYEEGTSHYRYRDRKPYNRRFQSVQQFALDTLFYRPFFGFSFAKYWYRDGDYDKLPMDCRYSIIPDVFNETFDKGLTIDYDFISSRLKEYLSQELSLLPGDSNAVFLITSKVYEHQNRTFYNERYSAYLQAIRAYISTLSKDCKIILKLHPREGENVAADISNLCKEYGVSVHILSKSINLPVELYLQVLKPSTITAFYNSSSMYNGYMYPKCCVIDLIYDFFEICEKRGYYIEDLKAAYKSIF